MQSNFIDFDSLLLGILFFIFFLSMGFNLYRLFVSHLKMMLEFSNKHNLTFQKLVDAGSFVQNRKGRLFKEGHSKRAGFVISGKYSDSDVNIFNYSYTIGSGENSHTYSFTICEVEIANTFFPHIFLKSDKMWHHTGRDFFGQDKDARIKLEGNFEKYFNLYCTQDYEIETLQIFTPDLLNFLIEKGERFSIEFADNKIYFYDDKTLRNESDLEKLYSVAKHMIDKKGPILHRLSDDFSSMREAIKK